MKKDIMKRWVKALRSGKYKQGKKKLRLAGRHCCLGVLCEVVKDDIDVSFTVKDHLTGRAFIRGVLPENVMLYTGMRTEIGEISGTSLTDMNDVDNASFKTIANYIEKNYKKL